MNISRYVRISDYNLIPPHYLRPLDVHDLRFTGPLSSSD